MFGCSKSSRQCDLAYLPTTQLLAQANVDSKAAEVLYATTFAEEAGR